MEHNAKVCPRYRCLKDVEHYFPTQFPLISVFSSVLCKTLNFATVMKDENSLNLKTPLTFSINRIKTAICTLLWDSCIVSFILFYYFSTAMSIRWGQVSQ